MYAHLRSLSTASSKPLARGINGSPITFSPWDLNKVGVALLFLPFIINQTAYLLLYVDDILLVTSSSTLRQSLMKCLETEFSMKDLGALSYFLGISVKRTANTMFLSQKIYARDILKRAGMESCKPVATPVDAQK